MTTRRSFLAGTQFIADEHSISRIAMGGRIKFASFTDASFGTAGKRVIPAGTIVKRDTDNQLIPAADGPAGTAFLTISDALEDAFIKRGSDATTGLLAGGVFYEDKLPKAPTALQKTALGPKFTFQKSQGNLIITQ